MPWLISFVLAWLLFFLFADRPRLNRTVWGGIIALLMATFVDWGLQRLGLYKFTDLLISFAGCPVFYKFGPTFVIGILFVQFIPRGRWWQLLHILVFALAYLSLEILFTETGVAGYIHWHPLASLSLDLLVFTALTWVGRTFILPN
ncbi:hypothetical protein [Desulfotomaculum copahuensis]|uniref:Uncharacterized protein n=1 Tax=Desulfotomaculum copahuensis TaxID=1838280 RepID=A0A1B7LCX9_9FIRM|nr:hypothetical protein [Desulfotomaculum copahuensis]OAT80760.1 hypothetical protein A6M21_13020 [Desulfotomaculum copahuensis]